MKALPAIADRIPQTGSALPVVMDASGANSLGIVRGLARHGLTSLVLDHRPQAMGFASRYATGLLCPDPGQAPEEFGQFLVSIGQHLSQKGVLLITDDTYLAAVAGLEDELAPYFHFTAPPRDSLMRVMDKQAQCQVAASLGLGVPRTFFLNDTPPDRIQAGALSWPAILKAQSGKWLSRATGRQVILVHSLAEVTAAYEVLGQQGLMLQEIIPGGDDQLYTFGSCIARSGQLLAGFTGRKLRQQPIGFGTAVAAESCHIPELAEAGYRLLRGLDFFGPSQVEFKRDPADGQFKLIEINARFWKWHSLATACGANIAYATYCDAIGRAFLPPQVVTKRKVWLMSIQDTMQALRQVRRGRYSLGQWIKTLQFPWVDGVFAVYDPRPGIRFLRTTMWNSFRSRQHPGGHPARPASSGNALGVTEALARVRAAQASDMEYEENS